MQEENRTETRNTRQTKARRISRRIITNKLTRDKEEDQEDKNDNSNTAGKRVDECIQVKNNNQGSYMRCDQLGDGAETAQSTVTELWSGGVGHLGSILITVIKGSFSLHQPIK